MNGKKINTIVNKSVMADLKGGKKKRTRMVTTDIENLATKVRLSELTALT